MQKTINILVVLLIAQMGLITYLNFGSSSKKQEFEPSAPLVSIGLDAVQQIKIFDKSERDRGLEIAKVDGSWVLPEEEGFPANQRKVQDIENLLLKAPRGYPVGNTLLAANSFNLAEDNFEKKIVLTTESGEVQTIFLGSSPGARRVYARTGEAQASFSIEYGPHNLPSAESQWIDNEFLSVDREALVSVHFADVALSGQAGIFTLEDLAEGEEMNTSEVSNFLAALSNLNVLEVLESGAVEASYDSLSVELSFADGQRDTFLFYARPEDNSSFAVQRTSKPFYVKISGVAFNALNKFRRASFVMQTQELEPEKNELSIEDDFDQQINELNFD